MLWLNPLWLLEGPGQLHCDLVGITLVSAGVVLAMRRRAVLAALLYALAVASKYTFVLVGPWFLLFDTASTRGRAARALMLAAAIGACGAAFYAPFWLGTRTITAPVLDTWNERPGGTLEEVVGDLVLAARGRSPSPPSMTAAVAAAQDRASMGSGWFVVAAVKLAMKVLTMAVGVRLLYLMLERNRPEVTALGTGALVIAAVTLGAPKFEPWYLLPALPFFGLACTSAWRRWLTGAVALGVLPTFANVLPGTSSIVPIWGVISTGANVAWFFAMFRARYLVPLAETGQVEARAAEAK
jgi:alpha-1,6-mannosyltransferase